MFLEMYCTARQTTKIMMLIFIVWRGLSHFINHDSQWQIDCTSKSKSCNRFAKSLGYSLESRLGTKACQLAPISDRLRIFLRSRAAHDCC